MGTQTETLTEKPLEEIMEELFFISPEQWDVCPVCRYEGQKEDLMMFGRRCCREFVTEFDEAV